MHSSFDGHGSSRVRPGTEVEAADLTGQLDGDPEHQESARAKPTTADAAACDWRGDAPEPELDDLADACEKNQQPSRPEDSCEWRGDGPERNDDRLNQPCQSDSQAKQSKQRDRPAKAPEIQMPIPQRTPINIPDVAITGVDEPTAQEGKQPKHDKAPRAKSAKPKAGPSKLPPEEPGAVDNSPGEGSHSPWIDSLAQMPPTVVEKVNMGVKQVLEAAASMLTPSRKHTPEPTAKKSRKNSALAPEPVPEPIVLIPIQPMVNVQPEVDKKLLRKKRRLEKKARREAERKAKKASRKEKKQKRKEKKERIRKEKARKKAMKKGGGELPAHLVEGAQNGANEGQPDRSGRHGLDGNGDTPVTADGRRMSSSFCQNQDPSIKPTPPEVDWWIQAMRSDDFRSSSRRASSPVSSTRSSRYAMAPPPARHPGWGPKPPPNGTKTTVYEPRTSRHSLQGGYLASGRTDNSQAAYHFYLPFAVCHNFCCNPDPAIGPHNTCPAHLFPPFTPRPVPAFPDARYPPPRRSTSIYDRAETLRSESPPLIQDGICHRRSRSGSM
ncbi:hypothetical protein GGR50DRAFT_696353 [Xylaria sp. CBS 124048]|nr:hypothetical protein GGR50DRAFT_696353 [Xylaria sp. CBS 124048]